MFDVDVDLSVPVGYLNPFVTIFQRDHRLQFSLRDGTGTSAPIELGAVHRLEGRPLMAQFSFNYTYDSEQRILTLCGSDFDSKDAMCLTTVPQGTSEYCRQFVGGGGFVDDDLSANPHWNYITRLTPGVRELFANLLREANDRLIEQLQKIPDLMVRVRTRPPELSNEEYANFLMVFRQGEYQGLHDGVRMLAAGESLITVESTFGGIVKWPANKQFANVIGSDPDPKPASSWIALWKAKISPTADVCASYHFDGFDCNALIYGGHVVVGTKAKTMPKGSNDVYIVPICNAHNNDDNVYMEMINYTGLTDNVVWLNHYMQSGLDGEPQP